MALSQSLQQKLLQKLSPQQIQLMKLLQIPTAHLEERIKEELEENPALEAGEEEGRENAGTLGHAALKHNGSKSAVSKPSASKRGSDSLRRALPAGRLWRSLVQETALVEAPGGAVVQVEIAVGAAVLAGKEFPVRLGTQPHQLLVRQLVEFFRRDRLADPESS